MSLIKAGSSTNAALGSELAGGAGNPALEVTHNGAGPVTLAATHPAGSVGGVTVSKVSPKILVGFGHGGVGVGVTVGEPEAVAVAVAVAVGVGVPEGVGLGQLAPSV